MKIKPILFSTPMVQAILEGMKTQTRRICKNQPKYWQTYTNYKDGTFNINGPDYDSNDILPKYQVGDIMWVRETWFPTRFDYMDMLKRGIKHFVKYKADGDYCPKKDCVGRSWKPSIFMPKAVCRIFLEVTNVRVERLQDISEEDAIAEGVEVYEAGEAYKDYMVKDCGSFATARGSFFTLWQSINGEESWEENPWVWVYDFKRVEKPENF